MSISFFLPWFNQRHRYPGTLKNKMVFHGDSYDTFFLISSFSCFYCGRSDLLYQSNLFYLLCFVRFLFRFLFSNFFLLDDILIQPLSISIMIRLCIILVPWNLCLSNDFFCMYPWLIMDDYVKKKPCNMR